ncbi:MAG: hypothetical protein ABFR75_14310 [Acidobacteriota bacterium]
MKKSIFMTLVFIIALSLTGCGQKDDSKGDLKDESKAETVAAVENSMSFSSEEISGADFTLSYTEAQKHTMQTDGKKYSAMILQLANYDRGGGSWHPSPKEDGHIRVTVNFSSPSGEELKAGIYKIDGKMAEDFRLSIGIEGKVDGLTKSIGLYNGTGSGEIIHIDGKTISGKIDLKDSKGTTIKATFKTSYTKSMF